MAELTIGRIGLQDADLDLVSAYRFANDYEEQALRFEGWLRSSSLTLTKLLRRNLTSIRPGTVLPVTWTEDSEVDGWYRFRFADIQMNTDSGVLLGDGLYPFIAVFDTLGTEAQVWFQSRMTGTVRDNDMGLTAAEVTPTFAPPGDHTSLYFAETTDPTKTTRAASDGSTLTVVYDTSLYDPTHPKWYASPSDFYNGACTVKIGGYTYEGMSTPNSPSDFEISNGIIRVTEGSASESFNWAVWDGSAWDAGPGVDVTYSGATFHDGSTFDSMTILRNDPHRVTVRFTKTWTSDSDLMHTIDVTLRRGDHFFTVKSSRSGSSTAELRLATNVASTAITPTGATSACALEGDAAVNGHNWFILYDDTPDTTSTGSGYVEFNNTTNIHGGFGVELDGDSAATGDSTAEVALQYMGAISEEVRPIPR